MEDNITLRSGFSPLFFFLNFYLWVTKRILATPISSSLSVFHCWEETGIAIFFSQVKRIQHGQMFWSQQHNGPPQAFEMDESVCSPSHSMFGHDYGPNSKLNAAADAASELGVTDSYAGDEHFV